MFHTIIKLLLVLSINFIVSAPTYAKTIQQKQINFPIKADELLKGEVHYFFSILSPQKFAVQYRELFELDSLSLAQESNVMMIINKSIYVVNKPVGFFDDKQLVEEKYISHVMGDQEIRKTGPNSFNVIVPGKDGFTYKMQSFFDADDVSTLPNSKVIRGVNSVKKMDVISKSASTIMFTEKTNFSKNVEGGVSVSSFIPMNEKHTLIITYNLYAVQKNSVDKKGFKSSFLTELEAVKKLQESFK